MKTTTYPKIIIHRLGSQPVRPTTHRWFWLSLVLGVLGLVQLTHAGSHTWSGAGANTNWSTAANWSVGGAPTAAEAAPVTLIFPAAPTSFDSTPNVIGLKVDSLQITAMGTTSYTFFNGIVPVIFTGNGTTDIAISGSGGASGGGQDVIWQAPITLQSTSVVSILGNATLDIQSVISGGGGLTKQGSGFLKFSTGGAANTFNGTLRVEAGSLRLAKLTATPCFGGNLEIISGSCAIGQSNMIPDTASILIDNGALVTLPEPGVASVTETLGPVTIRGGNASVHLQATSPNTINFASTVTKEGPDTALIEINAPSGALALGGGTRSFIVNDGDLRIDGNVVDGSGGNGGITKTGAGTLSILKSTSFDGPVTVQDGILAVLNNFALGNSTGDTTVTGTGTLQFGDAGTPSSTSYVLPAAESLTVSGNGKVFALLDTEIPGAVTLNGLPTLGARQAERLTLSGVLSGNPSTVTIDSSSSGGIVSFTGTSGNTYSGSVAVVDSTLELLKTTGAAITGTVQLDSGTLKLLASNQIADSGSVYFGGSNTSAFNLNNFNETIAFAWGPGRAAIQLGNGTLTVNGSTDVTLGSLTNLAQVTGSALGKIRKLGPNTWTLFSQPLITGNDAVLSVEAGALDLRGSWQSEIQCLGGTLRGSALVKKINSLGGQVCLCDLTAAQFIGNSGGILTARLDGDVPGVSLDRMIVSGPMNLTGQTLQLSSTGFIPMTSGRYTIIKNTTATPITGTFNGLPEGAGLTLNGRPFKISYLGGSLHTSVELIFLGTGTQGPEITGIVDNVILNNGSKDILVKFLPNRLVRIQRSPDLGSWSNIGSVTTDAQGVAKFTYNTFYNPRYFFRLTVD